jgi:hypothetical protein
MRKGLDGKEYKPKKSLKERLKVFQRKGENLAIKSGQKVKVIAVKSGSKVKAKAKAVNAKYNTSENRQKVKSKVWKFLDDATKPETPKSKKEHSKRKAGSKHTIVKSKNHRNRRF